MQKVEKSEKYVKKAKKGENKLLNFNKPFGYDASPLEDPEDNLFNRSFSEAVVITSGGTGRLSENCDDENIFD